MKTNEAMVIGAGIGGLAAALAMQQAGWKVRVFEQSDLLGEVGAGLSIGPNGARALEALGVLPAFRERAFTPDQQAIRHYQTGKVLVTVDRGERLEKEFGARYFVIHRGDLHRVLLDAVRAADAEAIQSGCRLDTLRQQAEGVTARFANGRTHTADFLLGADGVRSRVRSQIFGAEEVRFTGYVAWRGLVPVERLPAEVLEMPSQIFIGPGHLINRYPVSNGRLLNFVAFAERPGWSEEGWNIPADMNELHKEFADWHPSIRQIIEAAPVENLFKWALCARSPLMRWVDGRVAVLGDAAHPLLPYLGQGAVMALEDAVILGRALRVGEDLPQALARYEAARVGRARLVVERSALQVPRFHAPHPEDYSQTIPADEALGLFAYDAATVPV